MLIIIKINNPANWKSHIWILFGIGWVIMQQGNENPTECLKLLDQLLCSIPLHEAVTFLC